MTPQPQFFQSSDPALTTLRSSGDVVREVDIYTECGSEYFEITHPTIKPNHPDFAGQLETFLKEWQDSESSKAVWVYYPWIRTLVHAPVENIYRELRSSRNRNLILPEEQQTLLSKRIGIAGMSVGSNILNVMALIGLGGSFKIADMDTISLPNLNRLMAPMHMIGSNKAQYFAQRNLEVDPYLNIECYDDGLGADHIEQFLNQPKLDLLVEEMDNPKIKIEIRKRARELGIPVVMAADNGDGALIDVERYDLDPATPLFNDRLHTINLDSVNEQMSFPEKLSLIAEMAGLKEATPRMQQSILQVGSILNTWPQLGTAAVVAGVAITFIARRILLGEDMPSGRYALTLEDALVPGYTGEAARKEREEHTRQTMEAFERFKDSFPKGN